MLAFIRLTNMVGDLLPAGELCRAEAKPGDGSLARLEPEPVQQVPPSGARSLRGVPLFGVLLSLEIAGEMTVGVAHFPTLGEMGAAARPRLPLEREAGARVFRVPARGSAGRVHRRRLPGGRPAGGLEAAAGCSGAGETATATAWWPPGGPRSCSDFGTSALSRNDLLN